MSDNTIGIMLAGAAVGVVLLGKLFFAQSDIIKEQQKQLDTQKEMLMTLTKQQSMELNLLRIKCGEYKLVEKEKK